MTGVEALGGLAGGVVVALASPALQGVGTSLLALVFVWSGAAKLHRPEGVAIALSEFGVTRAPQRAAAVALGAFELAIGTVLLIRFETLAALAVATVMLLVFAVAVAWNLATGKTTPCYCFGDSAPLSRNGVVRAIACAGLGGSLLMTYPPFEPSAGSQILQTIMALALAGSVLLTTGWWSLQRQVRAALEVARYGTR